MNNQEAFEFYQKLHFHEINIRYKINDRLQIPLVIILSFAAAHAYLIKDVSCEHMSCWYTIFLIVFALSFVFFIISIIFFMWVFSGDYYKLMPPATTIEELREGLTKTHSQENNQEELVSKDFREYLRDCYERCASYNAKVNSKRSERLYVTSRLLAITAGLLIVAFLIFTFLI